jgi:hypothetical protein
VASPARSETLGWLALLALAFLLFELTADSSLAVVVGCLKFGSNDLRIARRLRRSDPDPRRGRVCSWFYAAHAILRVGFVAFAILLVLGAFNVVGGPPGQIERQIISALLVILACMAAAAIVSWIAVAKALRSGVRVWMDATTAAALQSSIWPPYLPDRCRRAGLGPGLIVFYAFMSAAIALMPLLGFVFGGFFDLGAASLVLALIVAIVVPLTGICLARSSIIRIEAAAPWDCYDRPATDSQADHSLHWN